MLDDIGKSAGVKGVTVIHVQAVTTRRRDCNRSSFDGDAKH
jgi:hypothetical protein